jgi:xylan 1,4-beta-xylosidase
MACSRLATRLLLAATLTAACATDPGNTSTGTGGSSGGGGGGAGGGTGGSGGGTVGACSDPQPWTPPPAPAACTDTAPTSSGTVPDATITVDAGTAVKTWNRFYEKTVASDHAHTLLCTTYGRNIQNALKKAHAQAGFQYVRFHGILDDDVGAYSEDASGVPIYDWSRLDAIYDGIVSAGMRPLVELSFTPSALASTPGMLLQALWYNNNSPNISPPTGASDDWTKWSDFMTALAMHLEDRYGADEVRGNWYFEVWNEPSWMYSLGDPGYFQLYKNTVAGLLAADPDLKVGGPAGSAGESPGLIQMLITGSINTSTKLDFLTYHRYGDDPNSDNAPATIADVGHAIAFHESLMSTIANTTVRNMTFTGDVFNDEFGPSWMPDVSRDNEVGATYIVKTINLLGSDTSAPPPASYGYWAVSDLYEEIYTGSMTAYRQGNFGLLLKGDPHIPESFDVAKPTFNAYRLLHMMGDQQLGVTGGTIGDGVGAAATRSADSSAVQILVYNHVVGGQADSSQANLVSLTVNNLPFTGSGSIRVRQYIVDRGHANSYRAWLAMGSPSNPNQSQWVTLRDAAELCYYETTVQPSGGSWTLLYPQSIYGVDLFEITGG